MSAPSAKPAEGNTSTSRVTEQTKEQRPEVRVQSMFVDAAARGKAIVIAEAAKLDQHRDPKKSPKRTK